MTKLDLNLQFKANLLHTTVQDQFKLTAVIVVDNPIFIVK